MAPVHASTTTLSEPTSVASSSTELAGVVSRLKPRPIEWSEGATSVRTSVRENCGISGPAAKAAASSLDIGGAKKNPCAASASKARTICTWPNVSTHSTMADMPSECAMWITVSTTRVREAEKVGTLAEGAHPRSSMFDDVYKDVPWHLRQQRDESGT